MIRARAGLCAALVTLSAPALGQDSWTLPDGQAFVSAQIAAPGRGAFEARLSAPTIRYAHGVLGGIPMFSRLTLTVKDCESCPKVEAIADLPPELVFEDTAPRLWDIDRDGKVAVVVVEAHQKNGARLAVWAVKAGQLTRSFASDFIGSPQRWLAPAGFGDFDGDGRVEIAFVDRPHLARELVLVRREGQKLVEIARIPGYSNHRIGDRTIQSGTRNCRLGDELILPNADHSRLIAFRLDQGPTDLGPYDRAALAAAFVCDQ